MARFIERRPMGTARVVDGKIVLDAGGGPGTSARSPRRPDDVVQSRQQLGEIEKIIKKHRPRKGTTFYRLIMQSRAEHKGVVDRAVYKRDLLRAARQRGERSPGDHLAMAGELQAGLQEDIDLTPEEKRTVRRAVIWNLQQAK